LVRVFFMFGCSFFGGAGSGDKLSPWSRNWGPLQLATQARDCNASPSADLEWSYALENDRPVTLNLFGPLLGNATLSENPEAAKDVHVTIPTPTGSSVQVTIDAAYEVAHYRIALKGTVDALVCDAK